MGENKEYITCPDEKGSINVSEEVLAVIAANAALETEGVTALSSSGSRDISELLGKKNISKGIRIQSAEDGLKIDVYLLTKLGVSVHKVGADVQSSVASAIESTTGISVTEVNVHVLGISLDK